MTEMVEKVARAIASSQDENKNDYWYGDYIEHARAAIEAMREPTEYMASAGWLTNMADDGQGPDDCWRKMIDEALKE